jgi:nucleotide-binding universal stress UspA family protein
MSRKRDQEVVSMFSNVIVPLDGSGLAEQALPWAEALATAGQAPLHLLRVTEAGAPDATGAPAREYLESVASQLGSQAGTSVRHSRPAAEVIAAVREHDDPVIVLATRGATGMDGPRLGSVADQVVHAVAAPVLLIRAGMERNQRPFIRSILVTLDGSDFAEAALSYAVHLAGAMQASLQLVRVVETQRLHGMLAGGPYMTTGVGPLGNLYQAAVEQAQRDAETYLADVARRLEDTGVPIRTTLLAGMPDEEIRLAEQRYQPDLVVMASRGRGGANWLVFGSIAERVLKLGSVPLLVIQPPRPAETTA